MPVQGRPVLGVDISPQEIRVVEMQGRWNGPQITRVGMIPTPAGALQDENIVNPNAVGAALRDLVDRMGVSTREVVLGIAPRSTITRILDIPNVPDKEARTIIEGEMAHYQIMQEGGGSFDFIRLQDPEIALGPTSQVLLMAAEASIIRNHMMAVHFAGLRVVALEPTLLALYRAVFSQVQLLPASLCLAISNSKAEISIVDQGHIRLYRRVDIGTDDLISGRLPKTDFDLPESPARPRRSLILDDNEGLGPQGVDTNSINLTAANNLAMELQRSLDYYRREYPQASNINRTFIATNDMEVELLVPWLRETLRLEMEIGRLPAAPAVGEDNGAPLTSASGLRFMAAAGLAMRLLQNQPPTVPHFDLATRQRGDFNIESARRTLAISMAASVAVMVVGIGIAFALGVRANRVEHDLYHSAVELEGQERRHRVQLTTLQTQQDQLQALKRDGFPFLGIMDAVNNAVDPQIGLTEVDLDPAGRILLNGEAASDKSVITTLEGLKRYACFVNPSLDSYDSDMNTGRRLLRFKISSQLAGVTPPSVAGSTPAGGNP